MGWIKNLFIRSDESVIPEETKSNEDLLLEAFIRGETLTKDKALSIPAVSSSVDKISNLVAMLPIKLYKKERKENGQIKVTEVLDDIRTKLLNEDTKDTLDPFQLKKAIARDYLIEKGAYIYLEKNRNKIKSIRYIDPNDIAINHNYDPIFRDCKYIINGEEYETFNFVTVLRNTKNGFSGKSVVEEIGKSLETSFSTILYELGLVQKGGGKKGFLTSTKKLSEEAMTKLKEAWGKYYNSKENIIVLNDGLDFKEGSNSSVELQINERKKTLSDDIKEVFHISNSYDDTVKNAVIPIIGAIESALNKNFLLEKEKGCFYFAFDTKKITRGSLKERYEAYKLASDTGWLSINEIRTEEDYSAIDGLDIIKMNLANVLYDTKTNKFYTPNTGQVAKLNEIKAVAEEEVKK